MIEIIMAMIKTKFGFFQVQVKSMRKHAIELSQMPFCKAPERFDTVNMPLTIGKFILSMVNPEVFVKTNINQSVIASPAIGMNDRIRRYMTTDNGLQRHFRTIRNNFRINFSLPLEHTKNNRFPIGSTTSFSSHALSAKIRFIDLYRALQWRFKLTISGNLLPYFKVNTVDRSHRNIRQLRCTGSSEIQRKTSNKLSEFCFSNSRTEIVSIFNIHIKKLTQFSKCLTS